VLALLAAIVIGAGSLSSFVPAVSGMAGQSSPGASAGVELLPNSIAVLPFELAGPNPDDEVFASAIHAALPHQLGRREGLNVIARASVMPMARVTLGARGCRGVRGAAR
jgi:TolB-like protein